MVKFREINFNFLFQEDERFLRSFKRSIGYVKLLAELDLLKDCHKNDFDEDDDESNSLSGGEELSIYDSNSLQSGESYDSGLAKTHQRKGSNVSSGDFS